MWSTPYTLVGPVAPASGRGPAVYWVAAQDLTKSSSVRKQIFVYWNVFVPVSCKRLMPAAFHCSSVLFLFFSVLNLFPHTCLWVPFQTFFVWFYLSNPMTVCQLFVGLFPCISTTCKSLPENCLSNPSGLCCSLQCVSCILIRLSVTVQCFFRPRNSKLM
jgi:hypothetical protein